MWLTKGLACEGRGLGLRGLQAGPAGPWEAPVMAGVPSMLRWAALLRASLLEEAVTIEVFFLVK